MSNYLLRTPAANDDVEAITQVAAVPAPASAEATPVDKSTFVPAVRVPLPAESTGAPRERSKHSLPTFALGAVAGIGLSLVFFHVLAPGRSSPSDELANIDVAVPAPAVVIPRIKPRDITVDAVPVVTVTPMSIIERAADQVAEHHAPVTPVRAPTPEPVRQGAAPVAFTAATVAYEAPEASPPPAERPAVARAEPAKSQAAFNVISVPSASLALIAAQVQGQTLVSPYKVGQALPDGRVITAMDPATGTISTSSGELRAVAAN